MNKKNIVFIFSICIFFNNVSVPIYNISASNDLEEHSTVGLGYSINAVKSEYLDLTEIRDGSPIFDQEWLENKILNGNLMEVKKIEAKSIYESSFENILKEKNREIGISREIGGEYDIFIANMYNNYSSSSNEYTNQYMSQFYYNFMGTITNYTYSLPNYSSNLKDYINNLHPDYVTNITNLLNNKISATNFFDMYGTHVIAKGVYGGILQKG